MQNNKLNQLYNKVEYFLPHVVFSLILAGLVWIFFNPMISLTGGILKYISDDVVYMRFRSFVYIIGIIIFFLCLSKNSRGYVSKIWLNFSVYVRVLIMLFFIICFLSSILKAVSFFVSFSQVILDLAIFYIVLFVAGYTKDNIYFAVKSLYLTILTCVLVYSVLLLVNFIYCFYIIDEVQLAKDVLYLYNFANPRFLDHFFSWFLPILTLPLIYSRDNIYFSKGIKLLSFFAIVCVWFIIICHASRSFILEYFVLALFLLIFYPKFVLRIIGYVMFGFIVAFVMYHIFKVIGSSINHANVLSDTLFDRDFSESSERIYILKGWLHISYLNPWLGIGKLQNVYYYGYNYATQLGAAHNIFFEILGYFGVVALGCFTLMFARVGRVYSSIISKYKDDVVFIILSSCFVTGMTHAMVSNIFKESLGRYSSIFIFGMLLAYMPIKKHINYNSWKSKLQVSMFNMLSILIFIALVVSCVFIEWMFY